MKTSTLFWTGAILAVVGGVGYAAVELEWMRPEEEQAIEGAVVRKGSLRISETVRGNLEARNAVVLRSEIERGTTILYLIEEGAQVKPGDLVCELDVSELEDRQVEQEITVNRAKASLTKAEEQFAIRRSRTAPTWPRPSCSCASPRWTSRSTWGGRAPRSGRTT